MNRRTTPRARLQDGLDAIAQRRRVRDAEAVRAEQQNAGLTDTSDEIGELLAAYDLGISRFALLGNQADRGSSSAFPTGGPCARGAVGLSGWPRCRTGSS